ncbi:MAG: T9SS type A sorting domain-containing protein [Bacteroidota bacterium]
MKVIPKGYLHHMKPSYQTIFGIALALFLSFSQNSNAQEWEQLSPSPFPGRHHGIGFSAGGYGYVISGSVSNDVWKYDPVNDTWQQLADYSDLQRGFGIGDMDGDIGYFGFGQTFGGSFNGNTNDLWRFDGPTESFEQLSDCPCAPRTHPALVYYNDKLYMGLGSNNGNLGDWWEYDIPTDTWTEKSTFIGPNRHHPYQFVIDDYIYVGSGHFSDWYRYDPAADAWSQIADHPSYIRVAGAQFAYNGKGYTLSGVADYNNSDHEPMPTGEFWEYDPLLDQWSELTPHPGMSRWAPAYFIIDGWVYLVAGETYDGESATYRYQLDPGVTSIEEVQENKIELYPMPFEDVFFLPQDIKWKSIRVFDVSGAQMSGIEVNGRTVNASSLAKGAYILEINDGQQFYRQSIIKH